MIDIMKVLGELRKASLRTNLAKCHFGKKQAQCLKYMVKKGKVSPVVCKVQAIL